MKPDRVAAANDLLASAAAGKAVSLDDLTGAYRRGPGFVELEREIARARRTDQSLILAFLDVDGLKALNDAAGEAAGDHVLRQVAVALRTKLRGYDLIIRFGGDEFLCAIPGVSRADAVTRLAAVNAAVGQATEQASFTVGFAQLHADDSIEDLIDRADADLFEARQQRAKAHGLS